jgi:predicted nucleic acid-binding protein
VILVLDVSAAIEIILQKEKKEKFRSACEGASWVIAPDLYSSELANVLWKYHKAGILNHEQCVEFGEDGMGLIDDFLPSTDLWKEALGEGIKRGHCVYDMLYAVVARRNDATLATNDVSLAQICRKMKVKLVH